MASTTSRKASRRKPTSSAPASHMRTDFLLAHAQVAARPGLRALYEAAFPGEERIPWPERLQLATRMPPSAPALAAAPPPPPAPPVP